MDTSGQPTDAGTTVIVPPTTNTPERLTFYGVNHYRDQSGRSLTIEEEIVIERQPDGAERSVFTGRKDYVATCAVSLHPSRPPVVLRVPLPQCRGLVDAYHQLNDADWLNKEVHRLLAEQANEARAQAPRIILGGKAGG